MSADREPACVRDGWIPVDKRMPPKHTEVLIAFRDTPLPATGQYTASHHDTWGWCFPKENDPEDTGPITHWMPLPEHPTVLAASPTPDEQRAQAAQEDVEATVDRVCNDVAELPDRNSPEDWPEAMLVTHDELAEIARTALAGGQQP